MQLFRETFLLFSLNLLDALLTLIWVRTGVTTEANHLMAQLLDVGDYAFLGVKLAVGTITAVVILKWGYVRIARPLVSVAIALYIGLMGVHIMTGLAAFGYVTASALPDIAKWSSTIFAALL
jgi:hypothetical protein